MCIDDPLGLYDEDEEFIRSDNEDAE